MPETPDPDALGRALRDLLLAEARYNIAAAIIERSTAAA